MSDTGNQIAQAPTNEAPDRPISLVDATQPPESDNGGESRRNSRSPSWKQLAKNPTRNSVREGLARWKYSKWQQDRFASALDPESQSEEEISGPTKLGTTSSQLAHQEAVGHTQTKTSDFASRQESPQRGRERIKKTKDPSPKPKAEKQPSEIDVLYENQRGWFFFGIPLYSHSSLLNFDPSPWVTKEGKDSAVNITNAQLPDPSWEWAWKSWYVDMSYDVDEEGWQYSFSFSRNFSWHGTHPWFHCFVRRRRWLRKRVRRQEIRMRRKNASGIGVGHTLASDYFTIHSKRGRSPGSGLENTTTRGSSHTSRKTAEEVDLPPEDIKDIPSLMKALKLATIDREKIDAVQKFVETGGEELLYLERRIPEILEFFVFQASQRQLLEYLANQSSEQQTYDKSNDKSNEQHAKNLANAVRAVETQISSLEYWSDRQHVLKAASKTGHSHRSMYSESSVMTMPKENNLVDVIKGIAGDAEVGIDPTKKVLSPPPENRVALNYVDGQSERQESEEMEVTQSTAEETPKGLPPDSVRIDD